MITAVLQSEWSRDFGRGIRVLSLSIWWLGFELIVLNIRLMAKFERKGES